MKEAREKKFARLCWNKNNWKTPSGSQSKSKNKDAFEYLHGYGHEEWLFDLDKVLDDGYHYGFLEAVRRKIGEGLSCHVGKTYDVFFYTANPNGEYEYVGWIENLECIHPNQSKEAWKQYLQKGWLKEMINDVKRVNLVSEDFEQEEYARLFNVRFKISNLHLNASNRPIIPKSNANLKSKYYNLTNLKDDLPSVESVAQEDHVHNNNSQIRHTKGEEKDIDLRHTRIENSVFEVLKREGYAEIYREDCYVDIKAKTKSGEWHYFEIKTSSAKQSIREALGQILEYNHYPDKQRAKKMVIISPYRPDYLDLKYLETLRSLYHLPIWFRYYDTEKKVLEDCV